MATVFQSTIKSFRTLENREELSAPLTVFARLKEGAASMVATTAFSFQLVACGAVRANAKHLRYEP